MILFTADNLLENPEQYRDDILKGEFIDFFDGANTFKNIQPRNNYDELASKMLSLFPGYKINYNFVRKSPLYQKEPNFIHKDDMMGDITCILYLNDKYPKEDGTTIYDDDDNVLCKIHSRFNRMIAFESNMSHSRNIFDNFGEGDESRLIQVIFLKNEQ